MTMATTLSAPPVLSTPAEYTFTEDPTSSSALKEADKPNRSDDELFDVYEIARAAAEIATKGWRRVALQFPDAMLGDASWVVGALSRELEGLPPLRGPQEVESRDELEIDINAKTGQRPAPETSTRQGEAEEKTTPRFYILADTSYSACCVDEIAAEHADADAVVHYGRACLSPTARLPVLHIFTRQKLDYDAVVEAFEKEFTEKKDKVVIMADVMFQEHVGPVCHRLQEKGWESVVATEIVRDPSATIPNRRLVPPENRTSDTTGLKAEASPEIKVDLKDHHLFHISAPPTALLLILSSRVSSLHVYPTPSSPYSLSAPGPDPSSTAAMLRRRYGLVIRLATASIIGILVNTLSVQNYLPTVTRLKEQIAAAEKKSYTFVVGKLNAAKLANFAEVDGWVVVGCWESSLVDQEGMWKPVITPFELEMALTPDDRRIWDGSWWAGIEGVAGEERKDKEIEQDAIVEGESFEEVEGGVDDEESEPPEFDLRTGKLVSNSRPMRANRRTNPPTSGGPTSAGYTSTQEQNESSSALVQRKLGELAMVNGVASPGAEFLRSQRTWQGLGSDFRDADEENYEESTVVEEGRSGIARGYTVGENESRT